MVRRHPGWGRTSVIDVVRPCTRRDRGGDSPNDGVVVEASIRSPLFAAWWPGTARITEITGAPVPTVSPRQPQELPARSVEPVDDQEPADGPVLGRLTGRRSVFLTSSQLPLERGGKRPLDIPSGGHGRWHGSPSLWT